MSERQRARDWRRDYPVLVPAAEAMGGVAVIRSLGRAGYPVHACAHSSTALGLHSRYATAIAIHPAYEQPEFLSWLRHYIDNHAIRAIIPSEGLLLAVRPVLREFANVLPVPRSEQVLYAGLGKFDIFASALTAGAPPELRRNLPPTLLLDTSTAPPSRQELVALGFPLHLKVDACHAYGTRDSHVLKARDADEALILIAQLQTQYRKIVLQGHVPGTGVGAFFLLWQGKILAEFMHRRLHEVPHTGGVSSLRESWWHPRIRDDALARLIHIGWEGVAMMEYRWDPASDRFFLMEMNGRFWGSLHLSLYAGVDFPRLLLDAFHGRAWESVPPFLQGVRCRHTFPLEIRHLWSKIKDPDLPLRAKIAAVIESAVLTLDPRVHSDLLFPGDRGLYWRSVARMFVSPR